MCWKTKKEEHFASRCFGRPQLFESAASASSAIPAEGGNFTNSRLKEGSGFRKPAMIPADASSHCSCASYPTAWLAGYDAIVAAAPKPCVSWLVFGDLQALHIYASKTDLPPGSAARSGIQLTRPAAGDFDATFPASASNRARTGAHPALHCQCLGHADPRHEPVCQRR